MEVLITGVAGFIGSNLADHLLSNGIKVTGIDNFDDFYDRAVKEKNIAAALNNPAFTFIELDITNKEALKSVKFNGEVVVHLAAKVGVRPSISHPESYINNNITGTQLILDWMLANGKKKMVFASSSSVYGNNKKVPFAETDNVNEPISPYAFTKKSCELLNHAYFKIHGMSFINLRFFTVYGKRQRPDLAIHKFVKQIINGDPIQIYGEGNTGRDYTYVDDIVNGITSAINLLQAAEPAVYEIVNLGNSNPVTILELVNKISGTLNIEPTLNYLPAQAGDVEFTFADISKANKLLNYHPATPLETGLQNFVTWFKEAHNF